MLTPEQYEAVKKIFDSYNTEDHVDAFLAWAIEDPDSVKRFVDLISEYTQARFDFDNFLEI